MHKLTNWKTLFTSWHPIAVKMFTPVFPHDGLRHWEEKKWLGTVFIRLNCFLDLHSVTLEELIDFVAPKVHDPGDDVLYLPAGFCLYIRHNIIRILFYYKISFLWSVTFSATCHQRENNDFFSIVLVNNFVAWSSFRKRNDSLRMHGTWDILSCDSLMCQHLG